MAAQIVKWQTPKYARNPQMIDCLTDIAWSYAQEMRPSPEPSRYGFDAYKEQLTERVKFTQQQKDAEKANWKLDMNRGI